MSCESTFFVAISWWGTSEIGGRFMGGVPGFARILLAVEYTYRGSALYDIPSTTNFELLMTATWKTKPAYPCEGQTRLKLE